MSATRLSRRVMLARFGGAALTVALAGCQRLQAATGAPSATPTAGRTGPTVVLATSELVVGRNRFAVGILDEANQPIVEAPVTFSFFQLTGEQGTKRSEAPATFRWVDQKTKGIYTAPVTFDAAGRWGVEAMLHRDGSTTVIRSPFEVQAAGQRADDRHARLSVRRTQLCRMCATPPRSVPPRRPVSCTP